VSRTFEGCEGAYWIEIDPSGDVQVDNGSFGAGNLVVKGPFSVLVEGMKGSAPPDVNVVSLRGLGAE
jgi:sulfur transfer protein SufE